MQVLTYSVADSEWIAGVTGVARANGIVIDNFALGVQAARGWTRVGALLINAGLGGWALGAGNALGSASWRVSNVIGRARAHGLAVVHAAQAVGSAGRRVARVFWF